MIKFSVWAIFIFVVNFGEVYPNNITVCYYRSWAQYYTGKAKFLPENIDPNLCSVINYAAYQININTLKMEGREKNDAEMVKRLVALKKQNPSLKVQLTVGGWNHEKLPRFVTMVKYKYRRSIFINSAIEYLTEHNLDGINIDWEYPGVYTRKDPHKDPKEREKDRTRFVYLLQEMKTAFQKEAVKRNVQPFMLTLAVPANRNSVIKGYDIPQISKIVDWVNVMAYNLRSQSQNKTGCPTLMKGKVPNIPDTMDAWINGGMDPSKINLGLASYGKTFKLKDRDVCNIGAPTIGNGAKGPSTKHYGILAYYEICTMPWKHKTSWMDSSCGAPYASDDNDDTWVSYDNPSSIRNKVLTIVKARKLHGISLWALDFDDFSGENCKRGKYPMLKAAIDALNGR